MERVPMIELTVDKVIKLLKQAAASKEKGYVYEKPLVEDGLYFDEGEPSCLVGHVFAALGARPEDVHELRPPSMQHQVGDVFQVDGVEYREAVAFLLDLAQEMQDNGFARSDIVPEMEKGGWVENTRQLEEWRV